MATPEFFRKLLIVGIIANIGAILLVALDKPDTAETASQEWDTFRSGNLRYTVSYPGRWKVKEVFQSDVEEEAMFMQTSDCYLSAFTVKGAAVKSTQMKNYTEDQLPKPLLEICHDEVLISLRDKYMRFNEMESSRDSLGQAGLPIDAYRTSFSFTKRKGLMARRMRGEVMSTWNDGRHIALQFVCPEREYEDMRQVFEQFVKSYRPSSFSISRDGGPTYAFGG